MKPFYTLLFALSITLINPWGLSRGEIWTAPKLLPLLLIALANISILWEDRKTLTLPRTWKISFLLWVIFLFIGLLSTAFSPLPLRSLFGQNEMGDGWLYWCAIAAFTLTNALTLKQRPELARSQLFGLVIGGILVAISTFPQIIDWRIDYTATTGQLLKQNVLVSSIFKDYQPIGLYSHRLNAAIRLTPRFAIALTVVAIATIVCAIAPSVYPHS